ncbi:hypothetical protein ACHAXA_003024 [Cyclostephanos tholiformis]|uniref:Uncharacterized protein n=1 Tax=Cyclostephanos tholiformis TaxID=382380 RepID=A0ABD3R1D6_9STRA
MGDVRHRLCRRLWQSVARSGVTSVLATSIPPVPTPWRIPDHFDVNSLLAYAASDHRETWIVRFRLFVIASVERTRDIRPTSVLWKLPSTDLFRGLCQTDVVGRLSHDYARGTAIDLARASEDDESAVTEDDGTRDDGGYYAVKPSDGTYVESTSIVSASDTPPEYATSRPNRLISWSHVDEKTSRWSFDGYSVVGGGLTAVQAAQYCPRKGKSVISNDTSTYENAASISDVPNRRVSDFLPPGCGRETRGGGSVPPLYMEDLRIWERRGKLTIVDDADPVFVRTDGDVYWTVFPSISLAASRTCPSISSGREIYSSFVGALASLNVGPDGGDIMGARRAATNVSNALECMSWLRREGVGALSNPFQMLSYDGDSSSDDDSDSD